MSSLRLTPDVARLARHKGIFIPLFIGLALILFGPSAVRPSPVLAQINGLQPTGGIPSTAQQVTVGVYPISAYNLDIETSTYYVDTYVWFRWKGEIDPTLTVEFINGVERWGMTTTNVFEKPEQMKDGSFYQVLRVEGRFVQPFSLVNFPLDQQQLTLMIEDTTYPTDQLVYVPDTKDSGYGNLLKIAGWNINGWKIESLQHSYGTQFGDTRQTTGGAKFSMLRYALDIQRPVNFFIWKLLLPLLIVLCANWTALLLHPSLVEVRTAMPATALLTTVFLQQSYSAALPDVGYLVLLDKIYVLTYLLLIATIVTVIVSATTANQEQAEQLSRTQRMDKLVLLVQVVVFIIGIVLLIGLSAYQVSA